MKISFGRLKIDFGSLLKGNLSEVRTALENKLGEVSLK